MVRFYSYALPLMALAACSASPCLAQASPSGTALNGTGNVFLTASTFATGGTGYPSAKFVTVGDFNADGKPDLAVANGPQGGTASILLGKGDGTFRPAIDTPQLNGALCAAVGDFNADGKSDLAVINSQNLVVLLSAGDGTFAVKTTLSSLLNPAWVAAGDFNGDGKLDLAVVGQSSPSDIVYIFLGAGNGTFQAPASINLGASVRAPQAVVADLNKDGHPDLAIAERNGPTPGAVHILLGNGNGTFQAAQSFSIGGSGWGLAVGDFNNDGFPDIVATTPWTYGFTVLLGDGTGSFSAVNNPDTGTLPTAFATVAGAAGTSIAAGDFNKDGKLDVVTGLSEINGAGCVSVLLSNGNGTFQPQALYGVAEFPSSVAVADFNGDGNSDWVAAADLTRNVVVGLGRGDGTFAASRSFAVGNSPTLPAIGDFNKDGRPDVVVANSGDANVQVLLGNGDGTLRSGPTLSTSPTMYPMFVVTGDFNNDGNPDIVALNSPGGWAEPCYSTQLSCLTVFLGKGDGTFRAPNVIGTGVTNVDVIVAGDYNRDGRLDLAAVADYHGPNPSVVILLGNGDGTFHSHTPNQTGAQFIPWAVAGDLNRDGNLDLALNDYTAGHILILLGKGDGTFRPQMTLSTNPGVSGSVLADFNGDGNLDLMASNEPGAYGQIWLGTGSGSFNSPSTLTTNGPGIYGPRGLVAADFDLDGRLDLVFGHANNNIDGSGVIIGMSLMPGNGDGAFQTPQNYLVSRVAIPLVTADFNNDGAPDVLLVDSTENILTVLLNQTPMPVQVSAKSLTFGNQPVGTASSAQALTVTNRASIAATIGMALAGDFGLSSTCPTAPATLAAGAACTISVTFRPIVGGKRDGSLTISYNLPGSPQTVALTGTGVMPEVSLDAASVSFGNQSLGTGSVPQRITLTNTGGAALTIANIAITGTNAADFSQTNTCVASLAAGGACYINITFTPVAAGIRTASLVFTDNAPGSPQTVALSGTGFIPGTVLITSINVAGGGTNVAPNTWVEIHGAGLAPDSVSSSGHTWSDAPEFASGRMPALLNGVTVTMGGKPAYIYFISPTQVNALTPLDYPSAASMDVQLTNGLNVSAPLTVPCRSVAPSFLLFGAGPYIAAEHVNGSLLGPTSMSTPGYPFGPAKPGETIVLFATGFGLPVTPLTDGAATQFGALPNWPQITIGGIAAQVDWAGVISPGLYQINVVVPPSVTAGDNTVIATYSGVSTTSGAIIPISAQTEPRP